MKTKNSWTRFSIMYNIIFVLNLILIQFTEYGGTVNAVSWNHYARGADWDELCKTGTSQSPIKLSTAQSVLLPTPLNLYNYHEYFSASLKIVNNGHTVDIELPAIANGSHPFITGALLGSRYEAVSMHFHWGAPDRPGSEHIINNQKYDAELHIIHKNIKYETVNDALKYTDGLAVLGIMIKRINGPVRGYPGLHKILNRIQNVTQAGTEATIAGKLSLLDILGNLDTRQFFTYHGSLTTPGCNEAVSWIVFPHAIPISIKYLAKFWRLRDKNNRFLRNNNRILQDRNQRSVYFRKFF